MLTHPLQFHKQSSHSHAHSHMKAMSLAGQYVNVKQGESKDPEHTALVDQTQKWVSQTFYGQLLKQMRNSPFKDKMFSGGRGGEAFDEMFDQKLADKMSKGAGHKLVDAIVNKIEAQKAYKQQQGAKSARHVTVKRMPKINVGDVQ